MRILLINSVCGIGSTGRICGELADRLASEGNEVRIAYGRSGNVPGRYQEYAVRIGTDWDVRRHGLYTRLTDRHGLASRTATKRFLKWAEDYAPDLLWLHNIHGYYINYELLFSWIKAHPWIKVQWTLHDCWTFTGHCAYFSAVGCGKWKSICKECPQLRAYPESLFTDRSAENYLRKKDAFTNVADMKLIVPSHWLETLVRDSFLKGYPIEVIPNKIDPAVFYPRESSFRKRYNLEDKKIVLGVASTWEKRKGLEDFIRLSEKLSDHAKIVLVGLSPKQLKELPDQILGLPRTDYPRELAEIYTAADVFVNPSVEETFGLTGLEAAACGTKTVCYKGTACEEVAKSYGGLAVERDPEKLLEAVNLLLKNDE